MPDVTGPLFSLTASGTVAKALTYATWRGVKYVRTRVVPSNPQTAAQTDQRNTFSNLSAMWTRMPAIAQEPWIAAATGQPYTDRNRLMQVNIPALFGQADMTNFVASPGVGGGPPPTSIVPTGGVGTITGAINVPTAPVGWTLTAAQFMAFIGFDPTSLQTAILSYAGEDTSATYAFNLSGLPAGTYRAHAWLKWLAPDTSVKYSISLDGSAVVT